MALGVGDIDSVIIPVEEHQNMWYPLETVSRALMLSLEIDEHVLGTRLLTGRELVLDFNPQPREEYSQLPYPHAIKVSTFYPGSDRSRW